MSCSMENVCSLKLLILVGRINERHMFLQRLIETKEEENISYESSIVVAMVVSICYLVFTALETLFYFLYNIRVRFVLIILFLAMFLFSSILGVIFYKKNEWMK